MRLAEIDRLRTELYRASPSLRTRTLLHRARSVTAEVQRWSLRPGQLVIVDEASMAGTFELDALTEQARTAGAKVLLVGDWAQLSPVSAGGRSTCSPRTATTPRSCTTSAGSATRVGRRRVG